MTVCLRVDIVDLGLDEGSVLFGQSLKNMQVSPLHCQTTVRSAKRDDLIDEGQEGHSKGCDGKCFPDPNHGI